MFSSSLTYISDSVKESSQNKVFIEDRSKDGSSRAQKKYKESKITSEKEIFDELTGKKSTTTKVQVNGKEQIRHDLQADHVQTRNGAKYNERYMKSDEESLNKYRNFFNSDSNFCLIHGSANSSKGDICICEVDGKIEAINSREIEKKMQAVPRATIVPMQEM